MHNAWDGSHTHRRIRTNGVYVITALMPLCTHLAMLENQVLTAPDIETGGTISPRECRGSSGPEKTRGCCIPAYVRSIVVWWIVGRSISSTCGNAVPWIRRTIFSYSPKRDAIQTLVGRPSTSLNSITNWLCFGQPCLVFAMLSWCSRDKKWRLLDSGRNMDSIINSVQFISR